MRLQLQTSCWVWVFIGLLANHAAADVTANQLTEAEQKSGWRLLFDGQTTRGWRNYRKAEVGPGWTVEDGALTRSGDQAGDIITLDQYGSFELQLEYRISPAGNSGLIFHATEEGPRPARSGPEVQIQDNVAGHDPQKSGWLYQLYKPVKPDWAIRFEQQVGFQSPDVADATRPAGSWNHLYLRVTPEQGEVCVNGVSYYYFEKGSQDWNERVARSKFATWPLFGKASRGHICLQDHGNEVAFRSIKIRELPPDRELRDPIDGTLKVQAIVAFPEVQWEGWEPVDQRGRLQQKRPLHVTHAGDDSDRVFVVDQGGMIHVVPNDPAAKQAKLYLDIRQRTHPFQTENEEGLLGFAFHPQYSGNGEFFVYYNRADDPRGIVLSRFRVSASDPDRADPGSEEVLMHIKQPFANHNGGPMAFGPDGYLYIGMGDGGGRNDPLHLGQDLSSWMGSVLRIDVDRRDDQRPYAIPKDNPFLEQPDALPEIYAYGFRNIWRLAFDRETGDLWVGDVGQDLWEDIHIVERGGNHGWSIREGSHLFGNHQDSEATVVEPVWEYDHQIGKSITGGSVYRGTQIPEMMGHYLYGDYISGKIWALQLDPQTRRVIRNMAVPWNGLPVLAFGEDQAGEIFATTFSATGRGIYRLVPVE